jgi:hypothetical protein
MSNVAGTVGRAPDLTSAARTLPSYGWFGLLMMAASEAGMLAGIPPFSTWHTPIAWTGYILLVDAVVWKRRGSSWLRDARAEFVFLAFASVPLWVIFELYNKYFIHNWYYIGLPESLPIRYIGYVWAFATISPAIFETGELFATLRRRQPPDATTTPRPGRSSSRGAWASVGIGAAMLALPIVYPSTYLAAPVWLGFIFLLDPLNARVGSESILGDWRQGRHDRLVNLMVAGLFCGLVWEFWNYWAATKWIYNVPILPEIRLFEMPILGFGGFPPFAVDCFTMYVAVRRWIWPFPGRPISL